jgi:imidazolonepropionase
MEPADLLIRNAAEVVTCRGPADGVRGPALGQLEVIPDGAVAVRDGRILAVGTTLQLDGRFEAGETIDATGHLVSPGLVDPHTHLVHAGSRHEEWEGRVTGRPPGLASGIRWTVEQTRRASNETLTHSALSDLDTMLDHGTTTVEAKSGYGLDRETELRILRITRSLEHPIDVVPTYLGAHVLPKEYAGDRAAYVALVIATLDEAAALADYCDVCCDPVGFTAGECRLIASAARSHGLRLRVHADQTGHAGGIQLATELGASSADHLEHADDRDIAALASSRTVGVLLPGVTHHMLEMTPRVAGGHLEDAAYPFMPLLARRLVEAGARLALATDYNPGTCPTLSMQTIMQLAARLYRLSYAEIWHMSTINAAAALDRGDDRGSLEPGKRADLVIWDVPHHGMVINRFGTNLARVVIRNGRPIKIRSGGSVRRGDVLPDG